MINELRNKQKKLPQKPGVYIFFDKNYQPLYVGKSKNLRKRTSYYFKLDKLPSRLLEMVNTARDIKFHVTENESEAFLLEAQLIKEKQPLYNLQYKNGRSLNYIIFTKHEYPRIIISKRWEKDAIGPFLSYSNIRSVLQELLTVFQIRTCSDYSFRRRKRPCLEYFAKRCTAPCVQFVTQEQYGKRVQQMKNLFAGRNKEILKILNQELKDHVKNEQFELAAKLRDNIKILVKIQEKQGIFFDDVKRLDIVLFHDNVFYVESIKNGAIINIEYRIYEKKITKEEILFSYYENSECKIIGKDDITFDAYTNKLTLKEKKILQAALKRFSNLMIEENEKFLWQKILNLEKFERVEAYDCSHYNSKFALCGMVSFNVDGESLQNQYKIWRYRKNVYNDLEILEYGLEQRKAQKEFPDLMIIDGGKTQLEVAKRILYPYQNIIAYAKGENRKGGIVYDKFGQTIEINNENLSIFLEKIRQAAHNWAKNNSMYRFSSKY